MGFRPRFWTSIRLADLQGDCGPESGQARLLQPGSKRAFYWRVDADWLLASGFWLLVVSWLVISDLPLAVSGWLLASGFWLLAFGFWPLVVGG